MENPNSKTSSTGEALRSGVGNQRQNNVTTGSSRNSGRTESNNMELYPANHMPGMPSGSDNTPMNTLSDQNGDHGTQRTTPGTNMGNGVSERLVLQPVTRQRVLSLCSLYSAFQSEPCFGAPANAAVFLSLRPKETFRKTRIL